MVIPSSIRPTGRTATDVVNTLVDSLPITVRLLASEADDWRKTDLIRSVRLPWDVAREGVERVRQAQASGNELDTEHALLVVWGLFAQQMGLLKGLESVPIAMGTGVYTPQTKLIEFFMAILSGLESLHELNEGAQPLAEDVAVAVAWLREGLAHYSGVSRTLKAAGAQTVEATLRVLDAVSQPFLQREVAELMKRHGRVEMDVDLAGRPVSSTSRTYLNSQFGWMDNEVQLGYQAALLSLTGQAVSRLWVVGHHLPGNARPGECLRELVRAAEAKLNMRPRRRVELVAQRETQVTHQEIAGYHQSASYLAQAHQDLVQVNLWRAELAEAELEVEHLEQVYQAKQWTAKPHSQLARARGWVIQWAKKIQRGLKAIELNEQRALRVDQDIARWDAERLALAARRAELEVDNQTNPNPVTIQMRIDAGFGSGPEIAWLIEMGYIVYTKAYSDKVTQAMRRRLSPQAIWHRVGANADVTPLIGQALKQCPYPVELMLARYTLPNETMFAVLVRYDPDAPKAEAFHTLKAWFDRYNARQIIEAGIREGKGVLTLRKPLVRSPAGLELQLHFALFGANLIRWAAHWMRSLLRQTNAAFLTALSEVKTMVTVGAHSTARWVRTTIGTCLVWPADGPFAGTIILLSGWLTYQLTLPLWECSENAEPMNSLAAVAQ
jgi:hypothetical protein